jgi:hypothetical protein
MGFNSLSKELKAPRVKARGVFFFRKKFVLPVSYPLFYELENVLMKCCEMSEVCDKVELSESPTKKRGKKMKFVIRRAVAGLLLMPVIAGVYVAGYAVLIGLGAEATTNLSGAISNGVLFGWVFVIGFAFYPQLMKFAEKVGQ